MAPIEYLFALVAILIAIVAMIRGYAKELGNTIVFMVAIFVFAMVEIYLGQILDIGRGFLPSIPAAETLELRQLLSIGFTVLFAMLVFASYAGRTFEYGGDQASGPQGTLLNIGIGILNGYLVAGTFWYFFDRYQYPFTEIQLPLTTTAQGLVRLLPPQLFDPPFFWMLPVALLILLRVRG